MQGGAPSRLHLPGRAASASRSQKLWGARTESPGYGGCARALRGRRGVGDWSGDPNERLRGPAFSLLGPCGSGCAGRAEHSRSVPVSPLPSPPAVASHVPPRIFADLWVVGQLCSPAPKFRFIFPGHEGCPRCTRCKRPWNASGVRSMHGEHLRTWGLGRFCGPRAKRDC